MPGKQPVIGATVKLDGEKEFKSAITDINKNLQVLGSELQKTSAEYADNAQSSKGLNDKNEILTKSISAQNEKLAILRNALAKSTDQLGENNTKTKDWQIAVNKAETELSKMNNQLKENEKGFKSSSTAMTSLGDAMRSTMEFVGLDMSPGMQNLAGKLDGVSVSGAALVTVLGGVVTGLVKSTFSAAETAKEISKLSQTTGMSVESYQEWDYVLKKFGGSMEQSSGDFANLSEKMLDASKGAGEGAEMFGALGVRVTENNGKLKSQERVFGETVEALQKMTDESKRNAIASALLGSTGEKLVPILNMTKNEIMDLKDEANTLGVVMSEDTVSKFAELSDALKKFEAQGTGIKNSFALALLPILTTLFEVISKIPVPILTLIITLTGVVTTIVLVVKTIKDVTGTAKNISDFFGSFDMKALKTTAIIMGVVVALTALAAAVVVLSGKKNEYLAMMDSVGAMSGNVQNIQSGRSLPRYATGTDNHPGGWAITSENGPELINLPSGSKVYTANETAKMLGGTTQYINVTIQANDIQQMADMVRIFENIGQSSKSGRVKI